MISARILSVRAAIVESSRRVEDALAIFWDEVCYATEAAARIEFVRIPVHGEHRLLTFEQASAVLYRRYFERGALEYVFFALP